MSAGESKRTGQDAGGVAASARISAATAIERCAGLALRNRFFWLALGCALYMSAQLNFAQYKWNRFDTMELLSHLFVVIEMGLLACALITALSLPRMREAWRQRWPGQPFNYAPAGLGGMLALLVPFTAQLVPLMCLHRYPELAHTGVQVELLLLQRGTLLLCAVALSYNAALMLRYALRAPAWVCALAGLGWHWGMAYWVTYLSFSGEPLRRLNDLFYVNQLWRYSDGFPELTRPEVVFNMQQQYGVFLGAGVLLVALTTLLWMPGALRTK